MSGFFLRQVWWFVLGFLKIVFSLELDKNFWSLNFFIDLHSATFQVFSDGFFSHIGVCWLWE